MHEILSIAVRKITRKFPDWFRISSVRRWRLPTLLSMRCSCLIASTAVVGSLIAGDDALT
jgi:hypothetical protein